ncbi:MAG: peptidase [Gammaproteobacteria bacterium RBG_16_57_12]|nr:MAG: peptidase [Gammaproteobacteria bacterium RBG_16_57_12]
MGIRYMVLLAALCGLSTAQGFDLKQDLKKKLEEAKQKVQPAETPSDAAAPSEAQALLADFSVDEEIKIGRQIAGNLLGASPLVPDEALQVYVNKVGRWVASQSERPDLAWHFGVIESADINAFAIPGGYVFLTRGLYQRLRNEAELAGVLAHEVAHVTRKHHLKILQKSKLLDIGAKALGRQAGEHDRLRNLIGSGAEVMARSLDKDAEYEADRMGVVLAGRAGYDPFGLPVVLQQVGQVKKDDTAVALLFKTHPHPDARLGQLDLAIGQRFDDLSGPTLESRLYRLRP